MTSFPARGHWPRRHLCVHHVTVTSLPAGLPPCLLLEIFSGHIRRAARSLRIIMLFHALKCKRALLTYCMEQNPSWEANRFVVSQEIPSVLFNPKVHYRIHMCLPPASILSQPNPVQTPPAHFLKIHPNIILPSMPGSPQWSLSLRFPHQNSIHAAILPHPRYIPRPSHSSRFYQLISFLV
jgi:hypothetical protein